MNEKLAYRPGGRGGNLIVSRKGQRFGGRKKGQPNKTTRVPAPVQARYVGRDHLAFGLGERRRPAQQRFVEFEQRTVRLRFTSV